MSQLDGTGLLKLCLRTGEKILKVDPSLLFLTDTHRKYNTASKHNNHFLHNRYTDACILIVDVWSIGCILAELLIGAPLFKGKE